MPVTPTSSPQNTRRNHWKFKTFCNEGSVTPKKHINQGFFKGKWNTYGRRRTQVHYSHLVHHRHRSQESCAHFLLAYYILHTMCEHQYVCSVLLPLIILQYGQLLLQFNFKIIDGCDWISERDAGTIFQCLLELCISSCWVDSEKMFSICKLYLKTH